jgi:repressor LexA
MTAPAEVRPALPRTQAAVLRCIRETVASRGYPPSVREIAQVVGLSSSGTVVYHLQQLAEKGWIRRVPGQPRAIEVLP